MSQIKVLRAIIDLFKLFLQTRNVDWFLRSSRETVSKFLFTNIFTGNFKVKMYRAAQEINPINTYQGLAQIMVLTYPGGQNICRSLSATKMVKMYLDFYTPAPQRGRGVYCFTSVHPSKIFFVAFFSVTVDGRNLVTSII